MAGVWSFHQGHQPWGTVCWCSCSSCPRLTWWCCGPWCWWPCAAWCWQWCSPGPEPPMWILLKPRQSWLERGREEDSSLGPEDVPSDNCRALQGVTGATTKARFSAQAAFERKAGAKSESSTQGGNDHWSTTDFPKALASLKIKQHFMPSLLFFLAF